MIINPNNAKATREELRSRPPLPSTLDLKEFGQAVAQFDLASVPEHRRQIALKAHILKIMSQTLKDKTLAEQIGVSHFNHLVEQKLSQQ